jgi:hypothetical protein
MTTTFFPSDVLNATLGRVSGAVEAIRTEPGPTNFEK